LTEIDRYKIKIFQVPDCDHNNDPFRLNDLEVKVSTTGHYIIFFWK